MNLECIWLVGRRATVRVLVMGEIVVGGAPMVKVFRGQHFNELVKWFAKQFGFIDAEVCVIPQHNHRYFMSQLY